MKWNDIKKMEGICSKTGKKVIAGWKDECDKSCLECKYFEETK